jgi:hypothetical protein
MTQSPIQFKTFDKLTVHLLPSGKLFRVYISDGIVSREVLWFKYNDKGDLVTKPAVSGAKVFRSFGKKCNEDFELTKPVEALPLTGNENSDHPHFTFHPSNAKNPAPILHGVRKEAHIPLFDTRTLRGLQEVVRHQLASPKAYAIRAPKGEDGKYHGMLYRPYDGVKQPTITFWVAPWSRESEIIPDEFLVKQCSIYIRCSPAGLAHDLLIQAKLEMTNYTTAGDMHILIAPTIDQVKKITW